MPESGIPLVLFDDPAIGYEILTSGIIEGQKYIQTFVYSSKENLTYTNARYLEDIYPNSPIMTGDLGSWDIQQASLAACGTFAAIACLAAIDRGSSLAVENMIYPTTRNKYGLYFIRICDPLNPLQFKWMAIDSKVQVDSRNRSVFCTVKDGQALLPALLMKAAATIRGGCWDNISNTDKLHKEYSWFPSITLRANDFETFKKYFENGSIAVTSFTQQYDSAGNPIKPMGIVYGHAFGLCNAVQVTNPDESVTKIIRVENPWGSGDDFMSEYSDDQPFWQMHPDLASYWDESRKAGGDFWVSWNQLMTLIGKAFIKMSVNLDRYPYKDYFRYEFIPENYPYLTAEWWKWTEQLVINHPLENIPVLNVDQETTLTVECSWKWGESARHTDLRFVDEYTGKLYKRFDEEVWWFGTDSRTVTLAPGRYRLYPTTRSMNTTDKGMLQVLIASNQPFTLTK